MISAIYMVAKVVLWNKVSDSRSMHIESKSKTQAMSDLANVQYCNTLPCMVFNKIGQLFSISESHGNSRRKWCMNRFCSTQMKSMNQSINMFSLGEE